MRHVAKAIIDNLLLGPGFAADSKYLQSNNPSGSVGGLILIVRRI